MIGADVADSKTARQNVKRYISLVRDFFKLPAWSLTEDTSLDRSGFLIVEMKSSALRPVGVITGRVRVHLIDGTVK